MKYAKFDNEIMFEPMTTNRLMCEKIKHESHCWIWKQKLE